MPPVSRPAFLVLLLAVAPASAQSAGPCGVAGLYALDRDAVHAQVVAGMDAELATLDDEPEAGTLAHTVWAAQRDAFRGVREEAAAGRMIPHIVTRLAPDGTAMQVAYETGEAADWNDADMGRWTTDAACETVVIDFGDHETTASIEGRRLFLNPSHGTDHGDHRVELLRVE